MSDPANPLSILNDGDLYDTQIMLALACGRAKTVFKKEHRNRLCFLFQILNIEADNRGRPIPAAPYKAPSKV